MPRTYWLIGATHGIGRAVAQRYAGQGHRVIVSGRDAAALAELTAAHANIVALPLDLTDSKAIPSAVKKATKGPLHGVHIYAGAYSPMLVEAWDWAKVAQIIHVNLTGTLEVVHHLLPRLIAQKLPVGEEPAQLALCASVAGYVGLPGGQPYAATKAAIINFAESLRAEMLGKNHPVDVRVICPGFVKTRLTAQNDFAMPMTTTVDVAAAEIDRQLHGRGFVVAFPKAFTTLIRALARLPYGLYFALARRMVKR